MKHITTCTCSSCETELISLSEKEIHVSLSENSRRDFLRKSGRFGLGLGIGGGLIGTPLAASALNQEDAAYKSRSMNQNKAVQHGKAKLLTLLHTADIHSQLNIHDEFFIENEIPVYR